MPIWRLDEAVHAGPEHLDPAYAAAFDTKSPTDWSEDVEALAALGPDATVVDLGAGTGGFALALAPRVRRVIAVDVSEAMVGQMRAKGIDAAHGGFLSYEHDGEPADAVYSRHALHHLPDFWKAIALHRIPPPPPPAGPLAVRAILFSLV